MTAAENPPAAGRSKRVYICWAAALTLLIALGLFCWLVAVPYFEVRAAAERCARHSRENSTIGPNEWRREVERLGGPAAAIRKIKLYMRLPASRVPNRDDAVFLLFECGRDAVPLAVQLLADRDRMVRWGAVHVLRGLQDSRAVIPLATVALRDKHEDVRYAAADALGALGDARAAEALEAALEDDSDKVRDAAAEALKKIRGEPKD